MRFLGNVLATIVGLFIFCMISFFGILFLGALFGGSSENIAVKENSVIVLDLSEVTLDMLGNSIIKNLTILMHDTTVYPMLFEPLKQRKTIMILKEFLY